MMLQPPLVVAQYKYFCLAFGRFSRFLLGPLRFFGLLLAWVPSGLFNAGGALRGNPGEPNSFRGRGGWLRLCVS